ncbi:MAG: TolC family protein [Calditrichaceae bacterium]
MRFSLIILIILSINHLTESSGFAQSVSEAIELAIINNPTLKAADEEVKSAELAKISVFRKTLPSVDFNAGYRHVTDVAEISLPGSVIMPASKIGLATYDSYETGLTASYVVFSGYAQQAAVEISDQQYRLAENNKEKSTKDIAFETVTVYRQVQAQKLNIALLEAAAERTQLQLNQIKSLVRNGMALPVDTLTLALAKLSYDQKIISAMASMGTAMQRLEILTGEPVIPDEKHQNNLVSDYAELEISRIETYKALEMQEQLLESDIKRTRSAYYPSVAVEAAVKYGNPGVDVIKKDWMTYGVWGAGVSWNLWSWGADRKAVESREAGIVRLDHQKKALADQIQTRFDMAVRELGAVKEQLKVSETALALARQKMKIIQSQSAQGMASATDFNDANLELTQAELSCATQMITLDMKINEIDYLSGQPINEWRL